MFSTTSEEVVEGDSVLLRCSYKNEKLSDTMFVVLWQKIDPITGNAFTVFNSQVSAVFTIRSKLITYFYCIKMHLCTISIKTRFTTFAFFNYNFIRYVENFGKFWKICNKTTETCWNGKS